MRKGNNSQGSLDPLGAAEGFSGFLSLGVVVEALGPSLHFSSGIRSGAEGALTLALKRNSPAHLLSLSIIRCQTLDTNNLTSFSQQRHEAVIIDPFYRRPTEAQKGCVACLGHTPLEPRSSDQKLSS